MKVTNFEEAVVETRRRLEAAEPFEAIVRFNFSDGTDYLASGKTMPPSFVKDGEGDAQATMSMAPDTFVDLTNGDIMPPVAMMTGKVKIKGQVLKAIALAKVLG